MAELSKPEDKVGPSLRPATMLCPDYGDTGRKTKPRARLRAAMAHKILGVLHKAKHARTSYLASRGGEIVATDHGPFEPHTLPFARCIRLAARLPAERSTRHGPSPDHQRGWFGCQQQIRNLEQLLQKAAGLAVTFGGLLGL